MPRLRYYITGHGLGHASRSCQTLQALHRQAPTLALDVVTTAPTWFLERNLPPGTTRRIHRLDVGVCQADSLEMDLDATLTACRQLQDQAENLLRDEVASLRRDAVDLVVTDVAALPCLAASRADIPAVILSNFTWDWIYEGFLASHPGFAPTIRWQHQAYRQATRVLRLPFAPPMDFGCPIQDLPLVARHGSRPPEDLRRRLSIPPGQKLGLLSFGGFGLLGADLQTVGDLRDWTFLAEPDLAGQADNIHPLPTGWSYPDLVNAADAILTKPGYGIVAEAIAHQTAVLYTPRGNFREQPLLVAGLHRYTRAAEIDNQRLRRGDWGEALTALCCQPPPVQQIACNGAEVAARHLCQMIRDNA